MGGVQPARHLVRGLGRAIQLEPDRKSTRLNSSHSQISYAVFCLKKKNMAPQTPIQHDRAANDAALAKGRADPPRAVRHGYDGTWVPHPAHLPITREAFHRRLPEQ